MLRRGRRARCVSGVGSLHLPRVGLAAGKARELSGPEAAGAPEGRGGGGDEGGGADDERRGVGVADDEGAVAAEERALQRADAAGADDEDVRPDVRGGVDEVHDLRTDGWLRQA